MTSRSLMSAVLLVGIAQVPTAATSGEQAAPSIQAVTYADFMKLGAEGRRGVFAQFSSEKKASIMKEHLKGWRARHGEQLSDDQASFVDEMIAAISPALYEPPKNAAEGAARAKETSEQIERAKTLFEERTIGELFTLESEPTAAAQRKP